MTKHVSLSRVLGWVLIAGCAAVTPVPVSSPSPAPLIERELFFDDPEIAGAQLSPSGEFITFLKPYQGVMNIWVKKRTDAFDAAKPLTAEKRPISLYHWARDSKLVLYVQDKGGDENFHLYAVDPASARESVPAARDLTPGEKLRAEVLALPKAKPDVVLIGLNDRDATVHDVYRLTLSSGAKELVRLNKEGIIGWVADLEGNLRVAEKLDERGGTQLLRISGDALEPLFSCTAEESCGPVAFHRDGIHLYITSNAGDVDLTRLMLLDVTTGATQLVESDPENQVDFGAADFSEASDELAVTTYKGDRQRNYPKLPAFQKDYDRVRKAVPEGDIDFVSRTADESLQLVAVSSDVDPGAMYVYERTSGKVELLYRSRPKLPAEHLAHMKPVRITARDGVVFTAYLTVPTGASGPMPALVLPHGGPWLRDFWGYSSYTQYLANRGYVVLQPNFRGSIGYGKKFLNLGNHQWGTGTMQHDISDARNWLVQQGLAKSDKIAILGGSYGGYATLAGLAFTPDLYAAGVDIVGPSSVVTLFRSIPPYWAPVKKMFVVRVGDIDDPEQVKVMESKSPLNFADRIKAPLLVIQGANDPRVKQAESDQIVVALRENKQPVEYMVAKDEGHGYRGRDNRLAMMTAIERFLGKHLGGRVQETISPEISTKLASLMVDVNSVTKPQRVKESLSAPSFDAAALKASTLKYVVSGRIGGKDLSGQATLTLAKGKQGGGWTLTSVAQTPAVGAKEVLTLDAKTLAPLTRGMTQGPASVELTYSPTGVKGSLKTGAQTMPIDVKSPAPLGVSGAPLGWLLGSVSLAPGYRAGLSTFYVQAGAVQPLTIAVSGDEQLSVPAGRFDAWRVELTTDVGVDVAWVEKAGAHRLVKYITTLPAGLGSLSQELTKD